MRFYISIDVTVKIHLRKPFPRDDFHAETKHTRLLSTAAFKFNLKHIVCIVQCTLSTLTFQVDKYMPVSLRQYPVFICILPMRTVHSQQSLSSLSKHCCVLHPTHSIHIYVLSNLKTMQKEQDKNFNYL